MTTNNIFIIDSSVADYQRLMAALPVGSEAFLLNSNQDGVEQMQAILSNYDDLDSIQIISHGAQGVVYLGNTVLNQNNIDSYRTQFGDIGNSLTASGDLLLYGCDVAQGDKGRQFIDRLALFTGADVAASDDLTGNAALGGDWKLETATGTIETAPQSLVGYEGLLGLTVSPNTKASPGRTFGENGNIGAFAALKNDGSVVTWGHSYFGGDSSSVANKLDGAVDVTQIYSTQEAFAALKADGSVVTWGGSSTGGDSSSVAGRLVNVTQIYSTQEAFAALKADGSVVTWGWDIYGGNSSAVTSQLSSGVVGLADINTDDFYIADSNNPPTGSTYINDTTPELGQILTASNDISDADGLGAITYQWKAGDSIVGVGETHTVTADEVSKAIIVTASYTDGLGKLESVSSATTEIVPSILPKANDIFEAAGRIGGDGTDTGILDTGMIRVMADFYKASYNLQDWENKYINEESPHAADAKNLIFDFQKWKPLDLNPILDPKTTITGPIPGDGGLTWEMETDNKMSGGYYTNGNAGALVARSSDAVVIAFRGTNDNAQQFSPNENDLDKTNIYHPDVDQWGSLGDSADMADHYALFEPLLTVLNDYVTKDATIEKIYVTGHSLGGAMAINYLSEHLGDSRYQGITFAAPAFTDSPLDRKEFRDDKDRLLQIEIYEDAVPATWDVKAPTAQDRPGNLITFVGDQTIDEPDSHPVVGPVNDDNHSGDYYRQITNSIDPTSWSRILAESGDPTVFLGAASGPNLDNDIVRHDPPEAGDPFDTYFIVDGLNSDPDLSGNDGNNILKDMPLQGGGEIEIFYGGRGADTLTGGRSSELMLGGSGNDTLKGLSGNDRLYGDGGNDNLYGGGAFDFDFLVKLYGGLGDDTYFINLLGDEIVENFEEGVDTIQSYISYTLPANIENLTLMPTSLLSISRRNATGNELSNTLTGNKNDNTLKGMDNIDFLYGNGGADTLIGGQGADQLSGGAGKDIFRFESITESGAGVGNRDTIMDFSKGKSFGSLFSVGNDTIDLSAIDANPATAGDDAFAWKGFVSSTNLFTHGAGELHYFATSSDGISLNAIVVEGDVNGDAIADFQIQLSGMLSIGQSHFVL